MKPTQDHAHSLLFYLAQQACCNQTTPTADLESNRYRTATTGVYNIRSTYLSLFATRKLHARVTNSIKHTHAPTYPLLVFFCYFLSYTLEPSIQAYPSHPTPPHATRPSPFYKPHARIINSSSMPLPRRPYNNPRVCPHNNPRVHHDPLREVRGGGEASLRIKGPRSLKVDKTKQKNMKINCR